MITKKILLIICYLSFLPVLNSCVQSTASLPFFAPALTAARTGSIYQGGLSYASNNVIKKQLGKTPTEYVKDILIKNSYIDKHSNAAGNNDDIKNIGFSQNAVNIEDEHNDFVNAIKKVLK